MEATINVNKEAALRMRNKYLNHSIEIAKEEADATANKKNKIMLKRRIEVHTFKDVNNGFENWNTLSFMR